MSGWDLGFIQNFHEVNKVTLTPEIEQDLKSIAKNWKADLTTIHTGFFSNEDLEKISKTACEKLALSLAENQQTPLPTHWQKIVESFHRNQYWGFETQQNKPKLAEPEVKKESMVPYIISAVQALIVMKLVILYFGIRSAHNENENDTIYLVAALLFSFSSLLFFAWKKGRNIKD